jgi:hypothetical protein
MVVVRMGPSPGDATRFFAELVARVLQGVPGTSTADY